MTTASPIAVGCEVFRLHYHYPDGSPALDEVSLAIAPGERVALLGPNGAGKSTLLLHLAALLPERRPYLHRHGPASPSHRHADGGRVVVGGLEAEARTLAAIRAMVGVVFADPDDQLIGLTVDEEVSFGPRARHWPAADVASAVGDALSAVGLAALGTRSPHHLSTGEKRRLCLAGALACRPGLLLLDEPSSGLDPRARRELATLLEGLRATQVLATHDLTLAARLCRRAIVMDHGGVVADGATSAILGDEALLERHGLR